MNDLAVWPELDGTQIAVLTAEVMTGRIVDVDGRRVAGAGRMWRIFPDIEVARATLRGGFLRDVSVEFWIYDSNGMTGEVIRPGGREFARYAVVERERMRWRKITAAPNFIGRALQAVFGKNPAEGLFLLEHDKIDERSGLCGGRVISAWRLDGVGLREVGVEEVRTGELFGNRMWQFQMVHFFIGENGDDVFLNEMDGPKGGMSVVGEARYVSGKFALQVKRASLLPGG